MNDPIAYTYEADAHCPSCAEARFGRGADGRWIADGATDDEGNDVGAVAPWDEWEGGMSCGTCGGIILEDAATCPTDGRI